ncbi:hypothetical protein ACH5RR_007326 [Cinchona calisaya]|uniref:Uncharacterized protein n=1 Tax=Cinchona calisaya TaxID=153742 RepID=A0ABD3ARH7_9GENT
MAPYDAAQYSFSVFVGPQENQINPPSGPSQEIGLNESTGLVPQLGDDCLSLFHNSLRLDSTSEPSDLVSENGLRLQQIDGGEVGLMNDPPL